jgi:antitoxin YefM
VVSSIVETVGRTPFRSWNGPAASLRGVTPVSPSCVRHEPFPLVGLSVTKNSMIMAVSSPRRGTIVTMTIEPLRSVRDHLSEFVDRAEREHERIVVTRNGRPAAVLLAYEDLAALEETLDVLSDPEALADIRQADAEVGRGDVVRGVDAVRALRPRA